MNFTQKPALVKGESEDPHKPVRTHAHHSTLPLR